ncbi:hypothetical protein EYZ11_010697 [Aspergillus tanneri]|uniref:Xylanolytic transcriptional activator regulatory domain-containing protein n=1 Tax=Aspergillus tanneri TaxID=1220188 RepID=A0A4S3J4N6_9EURO|nr:hypothetical protein EYZ11_010697 [Aspergillus tanneri]
MTLNQRPCGDIESAPEEEGSHFVPGVPPTEAEALPEARQACAEPPGRSLPESSSNTEHSTGSSIFAPTLDIDRRRGENRSALSCSHGEDLLARDFGYSTNNRHSTLGVLHTIGSPGAYESPCTNPVESSSEQPEDMSLKYRSLVRQLPTRAHIDILLETFFDGVNWHYDVVDEITFRDQLDVWAQVPYSTLQKGPVVLEPDIRVFPALLFQVLAQTLLYHPSDDERLEALKYGTGMTLLDVAKELSAAGNEVLELLGKRGGTIGTVQAGLLRAAFLKSSGQVVEAWHTLGSAIRDAQELGLHTSECLAESARARPGTESQVAWDRERRSRIWLLLHIWDFHMAVVLGRPSLTTAPNDKFSFPRDICQRQRGVLPTERADQDPPTPFSVILAGYQAAYRYLPTIHTIQTGGARVEDYGTVDQVHKEITKNIRSLPAWCRPDHPDMRFDLLPNCTWLPAAREALLSLVYFVLLALHRPYIFTHAESRSRALRAGLEILRSQARLFYLSQPRDFKVFNMVYASLDAIVLITAIYLMFPTENTEILDSSLSGIEWGLGRLAVLGDYNKMAKSAHGVVLNLYGRLRSRIAGAQQPHPPIAAVQTPGPDPWSANVGRGDFGPRVDPVWSNHVVPDHTWDFAPEAVPPPHPMQDLFIDHLSSGDIVAPDASIDPLLTGGAVDMTADSLHFAGTYADDSFWSFMNSLVP